MQKIFLDIREAFHDYIVNKFNKFLIIKDIRSKRNARNA